MTDLTLLQIGNCVAYRGPLNEYTNRIGKLISNDTTQWELQIKAHANSVWQTISADPRYIGTVSLSDEVLKKLGFLFNEKDRIYSFGTLNIVRVRKIPEGATIFRDGVYRTKEGGEVYDFGQYHVFEGESPKTNVELDEKSTPVYHVNDLQNFSKEKYGQDILEDKLEVLFGQDSYRLR